MRQLKVWAVPPPVLKPYRQPFATDAMPFENWIQMVLVPRLRDVARGEQLLPPSSNLADHAVREFDGWETMQPLIDALREVDALSKCDAAPAEPAGTTRSRWVFKGFASLGMVLGGVLVICAGQWVTRVLGLRTSAWLDHSATVLAALAFCIAFLVGSLRIARRRSAAGRTSTADVNDSSRRGS